MRTDRKENLALAELASHLGDVLRASIESISPLALTDGGYHSRVYLVVSRAGRFVLRMPQGRQGWHTAYLPEDAVRQNWFDSHWAIETALTLAIPAPKIVHSDRSRGYVLTEELPGVPIRDYETWEGGCPFDEAAWGALLARLHRFRPHGYGPIDHWGRTYFASWPAFLQTMGSHLLDHCLERRSIDHSLFGRLQQSWYPCLSTLSARPIGLLHLESLGFANLLYQPDTRQITGLLDYEDCMAGDPLYELVWMTYYYGQRCHKQPFFDYARFELGYGAWPDHDWAALLYRPLTYLDKLSWIDPRSQRAEHHRHALGRLCGRLDSG